MNIPTVETCYRLICKMKMLEHIVVHSLQVCRVATFLADALRKGGTTLNVDLVRAAALLHDITKTRSFETGEVHSESGCEYLSQQGYPEVGDIVRQHVKLDAYFAADNPTEAEIVNYADKRVLHDKIVSLNQRMHYILIRYGSSPHMQERLNWLWEKSRLQEGRIFSGLTFPPDQMEGCMQAVDIAVEVQHVLSFADAAT